MSELELWNEMGNMYYFAGAYDEAIRTYHKVIKLDPNYAQSYSNLASILVTRGYHAEAIPIFHKAIELTEEKVSRAFLWKQMGDAYRKLNDDMLAAEAYRNAVELVPEDASLQQGLTEVDLAGQVHPSVPPSDSSGAEAGAEASATDPEAANRIESEPAQVPDQAALECAPEPATALADTPETGAPGNACWMFMDKEAEPNTPESLPDRVEIMSELPVTGLQAQVQVETLEAAPQPATEDKLSGPESTVPEATSYAAGRSDSGILTNVRPHALLRLGLLHRRTGEYERALRYLEFALVAAGRIRDKLLQAVCHNAIARLQTDLGRIEAAIRSHKTAADLAPERIFVWKDLGYLNCKLGRYEEARAALQSAIERNPKDPIAWNGLGDVYHKLGRFEDAISAYQLGNVFEGQAVDEDLLKAFEHAMDSDQDNPLVWNEAGDIYFSLDAFTDAAGSYRRAVQLDPANPTYQIGLAKAEEALAELSEKDPVPAPWEADGMNPDTQPLPKNFMDELVSPKPEETIVIQTHSEYLQQVEPFVPETGSPILEGSNRLQSDPTQERATRTSGFILKQASQPTEPPAAPEPEPPYWMYKANHMHSNPRPAGSCFLPAITETLVGTDIPLPALELQTATKPTFSGIPLLSEADQEQFNGLVQMPPRQPKPIMADALLHAPVANSSWARARFDEDATSRGNSLAAVPGESARGQFGSPAAVSVKTVQQPLPTKESDIAACLRVTEINPLNDRAWDALGNKYETAGLYSEAIGAYEQAIVLAPQKEVYYYHMGLALAYQMHYDQAIQALEKVISLNPRYMLAHCALAGYYRKLGREDEARAHVAIARPSMETETEYNQACFESISGDADRALELLELAFQKKQIQSSMLQNDPDLDFIRCDPRFETLLANNGIFRQ